MVNLVQRRGESAVMAAAVQKSSSGLIFSLRGVSCLNILHQEDGTGSVLS